MPEIIVPEALIIDSGEYKRRNGRNNEQINERFEEIKETLEESKKSY